MRLLHVADVHLERSFGWLGHQRGSSRRADLRAALSRVIATARERNVDALCIAGDLFERENATDAVGEFLRDSFAQIAAIPVLIAPGNHDYFRAGCLYDRIVWPDNVHIFRDSALQSISVADGTIWGCAFAGPERVASPLDGFRCPPSGVHVGLLHADVVADGDESPYGPLPPAEIARSGLAFALLGHVHAGRVDRAGRFAYPGSIEPLDVSETGPRWALLIDASQSDVKVEEIAIAHRRALSDQIDVTDVTSMDVLSRLIDEHRARWTNADVKLSVVGFLRGELLLRPDAIRDAFVDCDVDVRVDARPDDDLDALANQQTTLGAFVRAARERMKQSASDAERQKWSDALEAGVAAFRKREVVLP